MIVFKVQGPYEVPLSRGVIDPAAAHERFWPGVGRVAEKVGCYVFAVPHKRGAPGQMPIYVGMATRTFRQECFNPEKLAKIDFYLVHHPATSLHLYLLVHPPNRGGANRSAIADLEKSLIKMAVSVNPGLLNRKNVQPESWGIGGLIR